MAATCLGSCGEAGPWPGTAGHVENSAAAAPSFRNVGNRVAASHFQPNICVINIKRKCFWPLSKHCYGTRTYNDYILGAAQEVSCMGSGHFYARSSSNASVIGNESIHHHGIIKIKLTASSRR